MENNKIKAVKPVYTNKFNCTINNSNTQINYRTVLPFKDYAKLVSEVAYQVVNDETGYNPFVYHVALQKSMIEYYTDYVVGDDVNEVYNSGVLGVVFDKLMVKIGKSLDYKRAVLDIHELIEFKKNQLLNKSEFGDLCKTISGMVAKKLDEVEVESK